MYRLISRRVGFVVVGRFLGVAIGLLGGACAATPPSSEPAAAGLTLAVPGRSNAHVSLAADGTSIVAAWAASEAGGATDVFAAVSADAGATFSPPVRVNTGVHRAHASGEQPPRVALAARAGRAPVVMLAWIVKGDAGTALATAQSDDGGVTFEAPRVVPDSVAAGNRGWQAIAARGDGEVTVAWLDHRRLAEDRAVEGQHQHGAMPSGDVDAHAVAMAQRAQLYFARLDRSGPAQAVTGGVCYCCKTAMGIGPDGTIAIAWRHVYEGNMRDIAFARSVDGGRTFTPPIRVSQDRWSIAGCPDDGPTLAVDVRGRVHVVWPTVVTENGEPRKALFHAMSADGSTFSPRQRIPTEGHANHPQLTMVGNDRLAVAWDEAGDGDRRLGLARGDIDQHGSVMFHRGPVASAGGVYPALAAAGDGALLMAWTAGEPSGSTIRIQRIP